MTVIEEKTQSHRISDTDQVYRELFSVLPVGIAFVDQEFQVIEANNYLCKMFGREPEGCMNRLFGNFFNCALTIEHGIACGSIQECQPCVIRKNVMQLINNGYELKEVEFNYHFILNGRKTNKWFTMNALNIEVDHKINALIALTDITKRKRLEIELIEIGVTDSLTGLYNRRYISNQLDGLIVRQQDDYPISVAMLDIDDFKRVNDNFGHIKGDEVLQQFAETFVTSLRSTDCVGRYGGDEFLIVLLKSDLESSKVVINRIARSFDEKMLGEIGEYLTFSGGLIEFKAGEIENLDARTIIDRVDKLLYKAKANGKNRIEV